MEQKWYILKGQDKFGPYGMKEMKEKIFIGELGPDDMIWTAGLAGWARAGEIKAFFPGPEEEGKKKLKNLASKRGEEKKERDPVAEDRIGFYALIVILALGIIIVGLYNKFFT